MRALAKIIALVVGVALTACARRHEVMSDSAAGPPNIVIVLMDDMGYGDAGCYGATGIRTPNIDRMAREGMRFTDFYCAQPVCSASRAALLTGCYPNRVGISGALGPRSKVGLSAAETTLADLCKSRGYATAALGKWHLGDAPDFLPTRHGFDEYWGIPYSNDMWPLHPDLANLGPAEREKRYPPLPFLESDGRGGVKVVDEEVTPEDQATMTREITRRAVEFIERNSKAATPFFLYVAHPMPHVPLYGAAEYVGRSSYGRYGDIIEEIDWSVGKILGALEHAGVDGRTLMIFTSDNGPWLSYGTHAGTTGGLREGKGTTWEGGVREPMVARWPGHIPAGRLCREPAMMIDVFPTVAGLIGAPPPAKIDGRDLWAMLSGEAGAVSPHEALLFYYHENDLEAVRSGRWKLVLPHTYQSLVGEPGKDGKPNGYGQRKCGLELYDLVEDPRETRDVAAGHPEVVARLQVIVERARADLGDSLTKREGSGRREPGRVP